jgi:CubicO group peptidase (beta-lactamase class C family)
MHQPGERFTYGLNTDVLGRLIEVASGQSLGAFLEQRLFAPLGMRDTGFSVAAADRARLATVYRADQGKLEPLPEGTTVVGPLSFSPGFVYAKPAGAPRYESGGAGLVSTAADYARFCAMLAGGGELGGVRVLGRKTVELMEADHLTALGPEHEPVGLGLGIAQDPGRSGEIASAGTLGWAGFYTTRFWIDPQEDLIGVVLTQTYPYGSGRAPERLMAAAYQALDD